MGVQLVSLKNVPEIAKKKKKKQRNSNNKIIGDCDWAKVTAQMLRKMEFDFFFPPGTVRGASGV